MKYRCVLGLKGGNKQTSHKVVKEEFLGFFGETKADIKSYKDFLDFHSQKEKVIHILHYTCYNINTGKYYVHCNEKVKSPSKSTQ